MCVCNRSLIVWLLLLMATEVLSVEPAQNDNELYTSEAFPEEVIDDEVTTEDVAVPLHESNERLDASEVFPDEPLEEEPTEPEDMFSVLDAPHKYVSEHVESLVTSVDKYFANDALYKYTTDSYLQLSGDVLFEETGEIGYGANLRTRVDLPGTKRRFKLIIDTDPTEKQDPVERSVDESPAAAVQESDVYASVQREQERKGWLIRPSVGVKFRLPLEPFAKLQFTNLYPLQYWQLRVDENLYWFDDSGFGSDTTFEFDRPVGNVNLFRSTSFARWTEETNYFELSQTLTLYQTLSPNHRISYQIGAYGVTSPTWFMTDYLVVVRYRQNLHKSWLFFEIRPQVQYSKINDWDDEVSLLLRLELLFGRKYL
jgi:hypothetical protein